MSEIVALDTDERISPISSLVIGDMLLVVSVCVPVVKLLESKIAVDPLIVVCEVKPSSSVISVAVPVIELLDSKVSVCQEDP